MFAVSACNAVDACMRRIKTGFNRCAFDIITNQAQPLNRIDLLVQSRDVFRMERAMGANARAERMNTESQTFGRFDRNLLCKQLLCKNNQLIVAEPVRRDQ